MESLPSLADLLPYPEDFVSLCRSWYVYTVPAVQFLEWRVIFHFYLCDLKDIFNANFVNISLKAQHQIR